MYTGINTVMMWSRFMAKDEIAVQLFKRLEFFHVNKSGKIECCGDKTLQIFQNIMVSQGLELKISLL